MPFYNYEGNKDSFYKALFDCVALYIVAIIIGTICCIAIAGLAMSFIHQTQTTSSVAVVNKVAETGNPLLHFIALLFNNTAMCLLMLIIPYAIKKKWGKYLIFGPIISLGFLTAAVSLIVTGQHNILFAISSLLPHGIFELSAFFLCTGYSLMVMRNVAFPLQPPLKDIWSHALKGLLGIVIPLLLISTSVETFITPLLMSMTA